MRTVNYANVKNLSNYDLLFFYLIETLSTCFIICALLINGAQLLVRRARYFALETPLNMLPKHSEAKNHNLELIYHIFFLAAYLYSVDFLVILTSLEVLHSYISLCIVKLLLFFLTIYAHTALILIYIYKILSPELRPQNLFCLWLMLLIFPLSADIENNPGPGRRFSTGTPTTTYTDNFFSFCNWNLNTLSKNEFQRVSLLEAHNTHFKYDIISLWETSLNMETKMPENILKGYNFFSADHPSGERKGGVGIFYKETLPLKIRQDLSFEECIVTELSLGRKKIFFTVLYRNPINKAESPEFINFVTKFDDLYQKIVAENPYSVFFHWGLQC